MPPKTVICGVTWMSALAPACVTMPGMSTAVAAHERAVGAVVRISLVERRLTTDALRVDDRRFTADGDRFLEAADAQVGVDRWR